MLRRLQILCLLLIVLVAGISGVLNLVFSPPLTRPVNVVLYPVNADGRDDTQRYIDALDIVHFEDVGAFFAREALRFGIRLDPLVSLHLGAQINTQPPPIGDYPTAMDSLIWSIKMRWWLWRYDRWSGANPDVRIFLRYFSTRGEVRPGHALGLQKGTIGLVNGFASVDYIDTNNVVIVHELMHAFGASDKYDLHTNEPDFPEGFANPRQSPLLPQTQAEIMAGRVKISPGWILMPVNLSQVVVGDKTAQEIGWRP